MILSACRTVLTRTAMIVFAVVLAAFATLAGDIQGNAQDNAQGRASGPLDGMVVVGKIGPDGNPNFDEELHFNNGHFWSKNCIACGYQPGPYWVRTVGSGIQFHGELIRDDGSTFRYRGRVADGRATVTVRWTKKRWYWSIDKILIFDGTLEPARKAVSVEEARTMANDSNKKSLPQWCA